MDRKSHFDCEIYAWGFKHNMHDFSYMILSNLKGNSEKGDGKIVLTQLAKTPQDRTMANKGGNL